MKRLLLGCGLICLMIAGAVLPSLVIYNDSPSLPIGFYAISKVAPQKGDLVAFVPPEREPFMTAKTRCYFKKRVLKKVCGVRGDLLQVNERGVTINGVLLDQSAPKTHDVLGRTLPSFHDTTRIEKGWVLMSSNDPYGFDARYFGTLSDVTLTKITPLLTW